MRLGFRKTIYILQSVNHSFRWKTGLDKPFVIVHTLHLPDELIVGDQGELRPHNVEVVFP